MFHVNVQGLFSRYEQYNNGFKAKLVSSFADVEERREEREESLVLILAPSLVRKYKYLWTQIEIYVRKSKKEKDTT